MAGGTGTPPPPPPPVAVDATVSDWSAWTGGAWGVCSLVSGQPIQTRTETHTRTVLTAAQNGGTTPALSETRVASQACTLPPVGIVLPSGTIVIVPPGAALPAGTTTAGTAGKVN